MKKIITEITFGLLMASGTAWAENEATFDLSTGLVNVPKVSVGSGYYAINMLQQGQSFDFTLSGATPSTSSSLSNIATYNPVTGALHIPTIIVGASNYTVDMTQQGQAYNFSVSGAALQISSVANNIDGYWSVYGVGGRYDGVKVNDWNVIQNGDNFSLIDNFCKPDAIQRQGSINANSISMSFVESIANGGGTASINATINGNSMLGTYTSLGQSGMSLRAERVASPECPVENTTTQRATITIDGSPDDWANLVPSLIDNRGDSACGADADIKNVYTAIDDNYAYVMVETYGNPINRNATLELNFNYKSGQHVVHGPYDDLTTNINQTLSAWNNDNATSAMTSVPINGYLLARNRVFELAIPLSELGKPTFFNATFANIWDSNNLVPGSNQGCDPSDIATTY